MLKMLVLKPEREPFVAEAKGETLAALQKQVCGYVDARTIRGLGCSLYFNDDARVNGKGMELNFDVVLNGFEQPLLGPIVVVRDEQTDDGVETVSLTDEQIAFFSKVFTLKNRSSFSFELSAMKPGDLEAGLHHKFTGKNTVGSVSFPRFTEPRVVFFDDDGKLIRDDL